MNSNSVEKKDSPVGYKAMRYGPGMRCKVNLRLMSKCEKVELVKMLIMISQKRLNSSGQARSLHITFHR
mgnify:CR=1 FL=1